MTSKSLVLRVELNTQQQPNNSSSEPNRIPLYLPKTIGLHTLVVNMKASDFPKLLLLHRITNPQLATWARTPSSAINIWVERIWMRQTVWRTYPCVWPIAMVCNDIPRDILSVTHHIRTYMPPVTWIYTSHISQGYVDIDRFNVPLEFVLRRKLVKHICMHSSVSASRIQWECTCTKQHILVPYFHKQSKNHYDHRHAKSLTLFMRCMNLSTLSHSHTYYSKSHALLANQAGLNLWVRPKSAACVILQPYGCLLWDL